MPRARKRKRSADVDETGDGEDAERNGEEEVEEGEEGEEGLTGKAENKGPAGNLIK